MLSTAYYIIKDQETLIKRLNGTDSSFIYAVEINTANLREVEETYRNIYSYCTSSFCIFLRFRNANSITDQVMDYLISICFHYQYKYSSLNELLLLSDPVDSAVQHHITEQFFAQGYGKIKYEVLEQEQMQNSSDDFYPINNFETIEEDYYCFLKNSTNSDRLVVINIDTDEPTDLLTNVRAKLENAEKKLFENDPDVYNLLLRNMKNQKSLDELNNRIRYFQEALETKNNNPSFYSAPESSYRRKITEIVEFYHYEYEVLPLWFKRLGHIVKVLTGKRTFKSLFNDNVKKYKDWKKDSDYNHDK
jgi:hypothetical protein